MARSLVLGKYELGERLAVGGMGEVFRATDAGGPGRHAPDTAEDRLNGTEHAART